MSDLLLAKIDQKLDVMGEQLARVEERLESAKQRGDRFEYRLDHDRGSGKPAGSSDRQSRDD